MCIKIDEFCRLCAPVLSEAERLWKILFAPGKRALVEDLHRVLRLGEQVHTMGAALQPGGSPFDRDMAMDSVGRQKDLGSTILRTLQQVIAVKVLK